MKNIYNKVKKILYLLPVVLIIGLFYITYITASWYSGYIEREHLAEGWMWPKDWHCPPSHPIKANLKSYIYHTYRSPYWSRTNAMNGKCFDTAENAELQGFRPPLNGAY